MRLPIEFFGAAAPTGNEYRAPQNQCGLGIVGIEARPCPSSEPAAQHLPTICVGGFNDAVLKSPAQDRLAIAPQGRSEARRVGKECVSTCKSRGAPYH